MRGGERGNIANARRKGYIRLIFVLAFSRVKASLCAKQFIRRRVPHSGFFFSMLTNLFSK